MPMSANTEHVMVVPDRVSVAEILCTLLVRVHLQQTNTSCGPPSPVCPACVNSVLPGTGFFHALKVLAQLVSPTSCDPAKVKISQKPSD